MADAEHLTARVDALADALRAAGVTPEHAARLLGSAATATMNALVLDAVLEEYATPPEPRREHSPPLEVVEQPLRVAA